MDVAVHMCRFLTACKGIQLAPLPGVSTSHLCLGRMLMLLFSCRYRSHRLQTGLQALSSFTVFHKQVI